MAEGEGRVEREREEWGGGKTGRLEAAMLLAGSENEGRGCEPKNGGSIHELGKARKWILPWSIQRESDPADTHFRLLTSRE